MGECRKVILKFLRRKNEVVPGYLGKYKPHELWVEKDEKVNCEVLMKISSYGDGWNCPWCRIYKCGDCPYGKKLGMCMTFGSNYQRITKALHNSIMGYLWTTGKVKHIIQPIEEWKTKKCKS